MCTPGGWRFPTFRGFSDAMTDTLKPRDGKDVEERRAMGARGSTSRSRSSGTAPSAPSAGPAQTDVTLDLSGLSGVTLYEPEELVLTARAGTPIAEIEALVASKDQQLAFEPMDYGPLLGGAAGRGTIGGVLAANLSGPRRIKAGAARDHFLGFTAVSGRGETFKSGGRVVKNVTGYDLCKLHGRLLGHARGDDRGHHQDAAAAGDRGDGRWSLGLDDAAAVTAMTAAMGSSCDVSGAAHLPAAVAGARPARRGRRRRPRAHAAAAGRRRAVGRAPAGGADGDREAVRRRRRDRRDRVAPLWRAIRDVTPFAASRTGAEQPLWRISTAPTRGARARAHASRSGTDANCLYDWAGGLRLAVDAATPATMPARRRCARAVAACGGHATLVRAPAALRAAVDAFEPQDAGARGIDEAGEGGLRSEGRAQSRADVGGRVVRCRPSFTLAQLADPDVAESEKILRTCVHCGFCTATCPTYVLLGDELDCPRGRIYLIKEMLEHDAPATPEVVKHIDRCLSCLACMTTCPSGVHYMHLVDHARVHIEKTYRRPLLDRMLRALLAAVLPDNRRFRAALALARLAKPLAPLLALIGLKPVAAMLRLAPARLPPPAPGRGPGVSGRRHAPGAGSP